MIPTDAERERSGVIVRNWRHRFNLEDDEIRPLMSSALVDAIATALAEQRERDARLVDNWEHRLGGESVPDLRLQAIARAIREGT